MKNKAISFLLLLIFISCEESKPPIGDVDFRQEMREFVMRLSAWSKTQDSNFIIIPQNGQALITDTGAGDGTLQTAYVGAIDATGRESMFYGYYADDVGTPEEDKQHLIDLCILCEAHGVEVLATDYCFTQSKVDDSYALNDQYGFIAFAADERELNNIPDYPEQPYNVNADSIGNISHAKNHLYLINSEQFAEKRDFIAAISATNYDVIIIDLFHNEAAYAGDEVTQLKTKANGGSRLVICYMSIGEAEDYRYYWNTDWAEDEPEWLESENPEWEGNYKVRYWHNDWQDIIYGNEDSYLQRVMGAGFDGVYLDIVDGYEYFEEL